MVMILTPKYNHVIPPETVVTLQNIKYGAMVEVLNEFDSGYHAGCKVYFFNKKGVLVGNYYQFLPYERLRLIRPKENRYPRYFMGKNYLNRRTPFEERFKTWLFVGLCNVITVLIKFTQKYMD